MCAYAPNMQNFEIPKFMEEKTTKVTSFKNFHGKALTGKVQRCQPSTGYDEDTLPSQSRGKKDNKENMVLEADSGSLRASE